MQNSKSTKTTKTLQKIPVLYTNADQLSTLKRIELQQIIENKKPLVIAINEIKPKNGSQRTDADYALENYTLHHTNLHSTNGRGIGIYIHLSIGHNVTQIIDNSFQESCLLEIALSKHEILLFGCIYRSPTKNDVMEINNDSLLALMKSLGTNKKYSHVCIIGDFNLPKINWDNWLTNKNEQSLEVRFIEAIRDSFLHQHITEHTRCRGTDLPSTIDLLFTDEADQVSNIEYLPPLGKSDHSTISFDFDTYTEITLSSVKYLYAKADFETIRNYLRQQNWSAKFLQENENLPTEQIWLNFKSKMCEVREKFILKKNPSLPSWKSKGSIPIDHNLRSLLKKKKRLHRRWISNKDQVESNIHRKSYNKVRNRVKTMMRKAKRKLEKDIVHKSKETPKAFWSYVRSKLKTNSGIAPLFENINDKSSIRFDNKEKADILQKQFTSVFTREPDTLLPEFQPRTVTRFPDVEITNDVIKKKLENLDVNKPCGPDGIHPRMLKELSNIVVAPLTKILQKSLSEGYTPVDWRVSEVSPIFKRGNRNIAANYRPISLTSIVCKIMESIIKDELLKNLMIENLLAKQQYGFIPGRSTTTQLLNFFNECVDTVASGEVLDTIYFDFSKAFDTVPHQRLLKKIKAYGIGTQTSKWIESFLRNRSQVVKVNGVKSYLASVLSGIPQGSVLGPILFVIYINDLPDVVNSNTFLFADDTKLFSCIKSYEDSINLQQDITALENWSKKWLLTFHPSKCHVLTLGKHQNIVHAHPYQLNGQILDHVDEEKDLGVIINENLKFETHIAKKINIANSMVGLIRRSFSYLNKDLFLMLYTSFVRPHLEYAQSVWSPHLKKEILAIENVQRRATKLVDGFKNIEHEDRLRRLGLPTLAFRRSINDMAEIFKHYHIYDAETLSQNFRPQARPSRKHQFQLVQRIPKDGIRGQQRNSFYYRTIQPWNDLPSNVVEASCVRRFKTELNKAWSEHPSKYNVY